MARTASTISVHNMEVKLDRNMRRYVIISYRSAPLKTLRGTYVAFAATDGSSDNLATARKRAAQELEYSGYGVRVTIYDRDARMFEEV